MCVSEQKMFYCYRLGGKRNINVQGVWERQERAAAMREVAVEDFFFFLKILLHFLQVEKHELTYFKSPHFPP